MMMIYDFNLRYLEERGLTPSRFSRLESDNDEDENQGLGMHDKIFSVIHTRLKTQLNTPVQQHCRAFDSGECECTRESGSANGASLLCRGGGISSGFKL